MICKKAKCENEAYGGWGSPHTDHGFCLICGTNRWYKRFIKRRAKRIAAWLFAK